MAKKSKPAIREITGRNPDGTFPKGVSGNPSGRPKNTLKDYMRKKFMDMTDKEKEDFLKTVSPELQWRMGEGNPAQDVTSGGEKLNPIPILGGISTNDSNPQGSIAKEED